MRAVRRLKIMSSHTAPSEKISFAIVGPQLIESARPEPISTGTVLIGTDGRIAAAGSSSEVVVPSGVPTLDASGMTLLPGLIDAHIHLVWDKSLYSISSAEDYQAHLGALSRERRLVRAGHYAQLALAAGVTTVRDCGANDFSVLSLRDAIDSGEFVGPRILASGQPITTTGGHIYSGWGVDSADDMRKAVRLLASRRVDFIKLVASGGTTTPGTNITRAQYTLAEMRVAVEEAHRLGLEIAAHAISTDSIGLAAEAGVDTIEHCSWIAGDGKQVQTDEAAVNWMVKNGVRVDHAIIPRPYLFSEETGVAPTSQEEWWLNMLKVRWPFLHHIRGRGVPVILGTDACFGPWPGTALWPGYQDLARAIEVVVRHAGFSPLDAIRMVTSDTARALRLNSEFGTIGPGKRADLILLAVDPVHDIRALRKVAMVFRDGKLVARNGQIVFADSLFDQGTNP
jgi:imidazolonepropionase-like amidohydrolase